jgi:uncharacterized protein YcfJ
MTMRTLVTTALVGSLALAPLTGCESAPGGPKEQGAVIGGVGGALAGAALAKNERGLGALIGGALGAGGGYLIGAQKEKLDQKKRDEAVRASKRAQERPARPEDVERTRTADLNDDGFVTLDEVVAMERASLSDREMLDRLQRTGQVFELTEEQERYLEDRGVSRDVVVQMRNLNQDEDFARTASDRGDRFDNDYRDREESGRRDFERLRGDDPDKF